MKLNRVYENVTFQEKKKYPEFICKDFNSSDTGMWLFSPLSSLYEEIVYISTGLVCCPRI